MVNFTVGDLDAMLAQLRAAGVEVDERVEDHEYGRFGWATDPEGNRSSSGSRSTRVNRASWGASGVRLGEGRLAARSPEPPRARG